MLVSVGGPGGNDAEFTRLVLNQQSVTGFANATLAFLNTYNLDGLELSWPSLQAEQVLTGDETWLGAWEHRQLRGTGAG